MITADLIQRRIDNFWGYGSLEAPVWFVGMEEGLGPTTDTEELEIRFRAADGKATIDMRQDMTHVDGHIKFFRSDPPIQPTLKYPIALYLYLKNNNGGKPSKEDIRAHQGLVLGDNKQKESTAIELMPLPSQKAHESTWLYERYGVLGLDSRENYLSSYKPKRVLELKSLIEKYSPKLVVFYSLGYLPEWTEVIGGTPDKVTPQMYFMRREKTAFCILPQGRVRYDRIYEFAEKIRSKIAL